MDIQTDIQNCLKIPQTFQYITEYTSINMKNPDIYKYMPLIVNLLFKKTVNLKKTDSEQKLLIIKKCI